MNEITKQPIHELAARFIPTELNHGDEARFRDEELNTVAPGLDSEQYRPLSRRERRILRKNGNTADAWTNIFVRPGFDPTLVRGCEFYGLVRIGSLSRSFLTFHDVRYPVGIYHSTIIASDIGDDVAIRDVHYLSRYIIGSEVILTNIDELAATDYAKFGNGVVKEGEDPDVRIWLEIANENGGRKILPYEGLLPADAYLWSKYRTDTAVQQAFMRFTEAVADERRGHYGMIGNRSVVKSCRIIKDVRVGEAAYIKGANKLKNLTIKSRPDAVSQIGEGVELVNGIIDVGCRIFYGVKAVRFYTRTNANLKYGARLINSILGDNGTISCCEVLNSLVYPGHEQHHNNSFLCAATLLGQSNIAAGATIGSNHNSRANDGEILAGRGFWPGLCVSLKHSSRFASYCLLAKGDYPAELCVPFPFALVSNDSSAERLHIMPAYWFAHNMYALARNSWKYGDRDRRLYEHQQFEYDYLAPDTVEEIFVALSLMEQYTEKNENIDSEWPSELIVTDHAMEKSGRPVVILKPGRAYEEYVRMVHYYGVKEMIKWWLDHELTQIRDMVEQFEDARRSAWVNLGGQLVQQTDVLQILNDIASGRIRGWDMLHEEYERLAAEYPERRAAHAFASLMSLHDIAPTDLTADLFRSFVKEAAETQHLICRRTRESREKDYGNPFRRMMYDDDEEMRAVVGGIDDNDFIAAVERTDEVFQYEAARVLSMLNE